MNIIKNLLQRYFETKAKEMQEAADETKSIFEPFPNSFGYARWQLGQAIADFYKAIANALS